MGRLAAGVEGDMLADATPNGCRLNMGTRSWSCPGAADSKLASTARGVGRSMDTGEPTSTDHVSSNAVSHAKPQESDQCFTTSVR